jgi:hypothetical protein
VDQIDFWDLVRSYWDEEPRNYRKKSLADNIVIANWETTKLCRTCGVEIESGRYCSKECLMERVC